MIRRVRLLHVAVLFVFGAITSLVLAVVGIAMVLAHNSETVAAIALALVIAAVIMLLGGLIVVALADAPRQGL
jgi:cytochrome c biogenesis protein CcdA